MQAAQPEAVGEPERIRATLYDHLNDNAIAGKWWATTDNPQLRMQAVEYVLADLYDALTARVTALSAQVDQLTQANMVLAREHAGAVPNKVFYVRENYSGDTELYTLDEELAKAVVDEIKAEGRPGVWLVRNDVLDQMLFEEDQHVVERARAAIRSRSTPPSGADTVGAGE